MTVEEYDTTAGSLYNKFILPLFNSASSALIQDRILLDLFVNFLFVRFTCANIGKIHTRKNLYTTKTAFIVCVTWNQPLKVPLSWEKTQSTQYVQTTQATSCALRSKVYLSLETTTTTTTTPAFVSTLTRMMTSSGD